MFASEKERLARPYTCADLGGGFFRDPKTLDFVKSDVLPRLLKCRKGNESLRIWVPGCGTGEEAYSIAILCREYLAEQQLCIPVQVFATDAIGPMIEAARR